MENKTTNSVLENKIIKWAIETNQIKEVVLKKGGMCDKLIFEMPEIKDEQIDKTYNGKPGCMCGCNGTYSSLKENKGTYGQKVSKISVHFVVNKLKAEAKRGVEVIGDYIYVLDIGERRYALYLKHVRNN
jgi:hypothetical protein